MEAILPTGHSPAKATEAKTVREKLLASYEKARDNLHNEASWATDDESVTLTYAQTGAGFTGIEGMRQFCQVNPKCPLDADYINRFNNECTLISILVDTDSATVHESLLVKTLFDSDNWAAFLLPESIAPHRPASFSPVTFAMQVACRISADGKIASCIVNWDLASMAAQLGVILKATALADLAPRLAVRLAKPNRSNSICYLESRIAASGEKKKLTMAELLHNLPECPTSPKAASPPRSTSINPALASRPESLFVTEEVGHCVNAEILATPPRAPSIKSTIVLTDGSLASPFTATAKNVGRRLVNGILGNEEEHANSVSSIRTASPRFNPNRSSFFDDDVPVQSVNATLRKSLTQFTSQIVFDYDGDAEALSMSKHQQH